MKNVHFPGRAVHAGQNFVFYSSLKKDDPILAEKASSVLREKVSSLTFSESSDNKMSAMVKFFDVVIAREQQNEKLFLQRQRDKFKDMPNFQSILKYLDTNSFNYIDFIKMLNIAIKGADFCDKTIKNELNRVRQLQKIVDENLKDKTQAQQRRLFERTIKTSTLNSTDLLTDKMKGEIEKTTAKISAEKIEQAMSQILKEPDLLIRIRNFIEENYPKTLEEKKITVTNTMIINYLIQALYNKLDITNLKENLNSIFDTSLDDSFQTGVTFHRNTKIKADSEEKFYVEGKGLADLLLGKLNNKTNKKTKTVLDYAIMNEDKSILEDEEITKILEFMNKIKKGGNIENSSITVGKTKYEYRDGKYIQTADKKEKTVSKKQITTNLKTRLSYALKNFINENFSQEQLKEIISSEFTIYTPRLAEALAGIEANLSNGINNNARVSGYLNLKNDVEFFISYNPTSFIKKFQHEKNILLNSFSNIVAEEEQKAREQKYGSKTSATTDPKLSAKAFFNAVRNVCIKSSEYLNILGYETNEIKEELKYLLNGLYVQESVKDVQFLNPEVGFKGGTLGGDWETALKNLLEMYKMGGLSPIDYTWLHFAIMNSSGASLGGYLKNPIQKYLSFAAAMMMFNYGGAELVRVSKELQKDFSYSKGPEFLNLYVLDGIYFPSSYILTLIRNGLTECQTILETEVKKTNLSETGVKIINKSTPAWIDPNADPYDAEWFKIRTQTSSQIDIIFTFLGGFLDIINELNERMSI